ncbi:distal membrane-arm assembly complex protein 1 isoform X1 [Suricata suricatta]|uniref:distal membrane-arm assembly complex protein 1 isoform X1 n=1 Tax=Suricata suricatta TaxID=37032 RepID=UPI00115600AB|nr:distal membrane-arm assembly complex protein 1 isoform X1 [Suricata suricatta]
MGSFLSRSLEPIKVAASPEVTNSAEPLPLAAPEAPTSPAEAPLFNNCWSCRVLSGSGLIGAGGHCLLGCSHPVRPQREGLPCRVKVPLVNLSSSVHVSMTPEQASDLWMFWTDKWIVTDFNPADTTRLKRQCRLLFFGDEYLWPSSHTPQGLINP